jgi:hypothetical protein
LAHLKKAEKIEERRGKSNGSSSGSSVLGYAAVLLKMGLVHLSSNRIADSAIQAQNTLLALQDLPLS